MKRFLAPILLLTLLFPTFVIGETIDDLVERDGIHYKKFSDAPFTGKITEKARVSFKNGKRHGPWFKYHENGQLRVKGNFKNGQAHGPFIAYHENGQLSGKGNAKNGKQDGPWAAYNEDGTVNHKETGTYKDGVKVK